MLRTATAAALLALTLTSCPSIQERDEAFSRVELLEARVEALQTQPPSAIRDQELRNALQDLEIARDYAEGADALTGANLDRRKVQIGTDAATGNIWGLIGGAIVSMGALSKVLLGRSRKEAAEMVQAESRKRDESREVQGIAAASKRSVLQASSPVARVAHQVTAPGSTAPTPPPAARTPEAGS